MAGHLSQAADSFTAFAGKINTPVDEPSKLAVSFDSSMKNIQSLMVTVDPSVLADISGELLNIGSRSAAGPNAIADAFYNIISGVGNEASAWTRSTPPPHWLHQGRRT